MHTIGKEFGFDYGHRVWTQSLNEEYSLDNACVCRHLHGHRGKVIVFLKGQAKSNGMVTDFKHLNWFKKLLDDVLDHKMILDVNDPVLTELFPFLYDKEGNLQLVHEDIDGQHFIQVPDPILYENATDEMVEILEGLVFVNFVPTSEKLSHWLFNIAYTKMRKIGVEVSRIQFFETPKSQSNYSLEDN